jgi:hypothetical protein
MACGHMSLCDSECLSDNSLGKFPLSNISYENMSVEFQGSSDHPAQCFLYHSIVNNHRSNQTESSLCTCSALTTFVRAC